MGPSDPCRSPLKRDRPRPRSSQLRNLFRCEHGSSGTSNSARCLREQNASLRLVRSPHFSKSRHQATRPHLDEIKHRKWCCRGWPTLFDWGFSPQVWTEWFGR